MRHKVTSNYLLFAPSCLLSRLTLLTNLGSFPLAWDFFVSTSSICWNTCSQSSEPSISIYLHVSFLRNSPLPSCAPRLLLNGSVNERRRRQLYPLPRPSALTQTTSFLLLFPQQKFHLLIQGKILLQALSLSWLLHRFFVLFSRPFPSRFLLDVIFGTIIKEICRYHRCF